jgi:hypothetical protein
MTWLRNSISFDKKFFFLYSKSSSTYYEIRPVSSHNSLIVASIRDSRSLVPPPGRRNGALPCCTTKIPLGISISAVPLLRLKAHPVFFLHFLHLFRNKNKIPTFPFLSRISSIPVHDRPGHCYTCRTGSVFHRVLRNGCSTAEPVRYHNYICP